MGLKSLNHLEGGDRCCFKGRAVPTGFVIYEFLKPRVIKKTRLAKFGNWLSHFVMSNLEVRAVS